MSDDFQKKVEEAVMNPKNMGEMEGADAVGTMGAANCGDMVRMWFKFREEDGKKVIDKASFQAFGCETAIAVAGMATEMLRGKSVDEAMSLKGELMAKDLGPLPPMKIHCTQLVEGAMQSALKPFSQGGSGKAPDAGTDTAEEDCVSRAQASLQGQAPSLLEKMTQYTPSDAKNAPRIVFLDENE
jgi:NifU-like protein involved in Fe-S cluster formation